MSRAYRGLARRLLRLTKNDRWRDSLTQRRDDAWDQADSYSGEYDCHKPLGQGLPIEGGFRYLGNGAYSWVFTHYRAPGVVFKVTIGNRDNMLSVNRAFAELKHPNLPVIHGVYEHTEVTPATVWTAEDVKAFNMVESMVGAAKMPELREKFGVVVSERLSSEPVEFEGTMWDALKPVRAEIEAQLEPHGIGLTDLHSGNMMWRGDTVVIIDPTTYVRHVFSDDDDEE